MAQPVSRKTSQLLERKCIFNSLRACVEPLKLGWLVQSGPKILRNSLGTAEFSQKDERCTGSDAARKGCPNLAHHILLFFFARQKLNFSPDQPRLSRPCCSELPGAAWANTRTDSYLQQNIKEQQREVIGRVTVLTWQSKWDEMEQKCPSTTYSRKA